MKFIKFEEKQWNKRGRICYANPYTIQAIHWPADKNGQPVMVNFGDDWKIVADRKSLQALVLLLDDGMMTQERRSTLLEDAVACAERYYGKEGKSAKTADVEEKQD